MTGVIVFVVTRSYGNVALFSSEVNAQTYAEHFVREECEERMGTWATESPFHEISKAKTPVDEWNKYFEEEPDMMVTIESRQVDALLPTKEE